MATGLRERWRINAMRTIQERALDLFDARGFDAVTIEEIAAAAEVSPSSVYRYFGTKEGLIVADEFDNWSQEAVEGILDVNDPVGSLLQVVLRYEATPEQAPPQTERSPWRRVRYFFQEPSVRMAVCAQLDRASQRIAPLMATGAMTETQARVAANALVFGYFGALEQWYLDGGIHPIAHYVEEGLRPLRRIWSTPGELAAGDVDERPGGFPGGTDGHPELSGLRIYRRPEPEGAAALVRG
jgi:AcrR family transcriptional regulator